MALGPKLKLDESEIGQRQQKTISLQNEIVQAIANIAPARHVWLSPAP